MQLININELRPHPRYSEFYDDITGEKWEEFLESIKTDGIIKPIIVTTEKVIISGHQRVRACKELGITEITCDIRTYDNEDDILLAMLLSNSDRWKEIPSKVTKCKIASEIGNIYKKRETEEKKYRDALVYQYRKEISQNRDAFFQLHNCKCDICNNDCETILEIHHILPLQKGGNNSLSNLMLLCPNCHKIIHKSMSLIEQNLDSESQALDSWIDEHYTSAASKRIFDTAMIYIHKKAKFGWEDLTWI